MQVNTILPRVQALKQKYGTLAEYLPLWWLCDVKDEVFFDKLVCMLDLFEFSSKVLGYKDLGEMHRIVCKDVEEINPILAEKALGDMLMFADGAVMDESSMSDADKREREKLQKTYAEIRSAREELKKMCKKIERERMFLVFRGGFKTTLITEAHSIQLVLIDPNIRIVVCSGDMGTASKMLRNVKTHFTHNEIFRRMFKEYCPRESKKSTVVFGTQEAFTVPNRSIYRKEETVTAAGLETRKTGSHYDYFKKDDLINELNCTTPEQLQKAEEFDQYSLSLFDNPAKPLQDYIGTRYHSSDIYGKLQERHMDEDGNIKIRTILNGKMKSCQKKVA